MTGHQTWLLAHFHLRLFIRDSMFASACIPVAVYCAAVAWLDAQELWPKRIILPFSCAFVYFAGQEFIRCEAITSDESLHRFRLFPIGIMDLLWARMMAVSVAFLFLHGVMLIGLLLFLRLTTADFGLAGLYISSSLPCLLLFGELPVWPARNDQDAPILGAGLLTFLITAASLPYYISLSVFDNALYSPVIAAGIFAAGRSMLLPRYVEWTLERIHRNE